MIIDARTHLFSPDVSAQRARYAERDAFFGQLYSGPVARMVSVEEFIAAMDHAGIDQASDRVVLAESRRLRATKHVDDGDHQKIPGAIARAMAIPP